MLPFFPRSNPPSPGRPKGMTPSQGLPRQASPLTHPRPNPPPAHPTPPSIRSLHQTSTRHITTQPPAQSPPRIRSHSLPNTLWQTQATTTPQPSPSPPQHHPSTPPNTPVSHQHPPPPAHPPSPMVAHPLANCPPIKYPHTPTMTRGSVTTSQKAHRNSQRQDPSPPSTNKPG